MNFTQQLAAFVVDTPTRDIPPHILDGAQSAVLDTVGCAIAGTLEPIGAVVDAWLQETGAREQATVWGRAMRTSTAEAAFANGVASHALDFDDSLPSLRGHPSAPMVPAALAVAEAAQASGESVLAALVLGLEVAGALGRVLGHAHYLKGWHTTATIGAFSAATVAARLWGLDTQQLQTAWGLAASQTSGLVRNFGTMTKPYHAGHAARCGVMSAWLARQGFTADTAIFDGNNSFFDTYGGGEGHHGETPDQVLGRLGKPWEMAEPGIYVKRWPCCYCNHRAVGGILQLLDQHGIATHEVEGIEVGFLPGSDNALISSDPQTGLEGKFSIEYAAAATVIDRKLDIDTFTDAMVQRPDVRALMGKVKRYRIPDSGVYSGVVGYTDVAISTARGRFAQRVERTPGSPAWPMTAEDHTEKFLGNARRVLGDEGALRLLTLLQGLRTLPSVALLSHALVPKR